MTFRDVLSKYPAAKQAAILALLDQQRARMRRFLGEQSTASQWENAYWEMEEKWVAAADRLLDLCNCAGTAPTMPSYRIVHLDSCPASALNPRGARVR